MLLIMPLCCSIVTAEIVCNRMVQTCRSLSDTHTGPGWELVHLPSVAFDPVVILQGKENYSLTTCIIRLRLEKNRSHCHFLAETKMPLYVPIKNWELKISQAFHTKKIPKNPKQAKKKKTTTPKPKPRSNFIQLSPCHFNVYCVWNTKHRSADDHHRARSPKV